MNKTKWIVIATIVVILCMSATALLLLKNDAETESEFTLGANEEAVGISYGIKEGESYARCDKGRAEFTSYQSKEIKKILDSAKKK